MDIKYFIRTTGERELNETYEQISYEKLVDKDHRYINFFIECLEYFSQWDSVFIEDDCILCKDFKTKIEEAITQYPHKVINFFTWPYNIPNKTRQSFNFLQNQCTYYPKGFTKKLAEEMKKVLDQNPTLATDRIEDIALKNLKISHIQYRPALVQHINDSSLLNHKTRIVRSPFFIDYLEDLSLDYENLTDNDVKKLQDYMDKKFINIDKKTH